MMLAVSNIRKAFGGLTVLKGVDFEIEEGKIIGLIGPNGAGKTTLFNILSGILRADSGTVLFRGSEIHRLAPFEICRRGIARTYQIVRPFKKMTCLENVLVGTFSKRKMSKQSRVSKATALLQLLGLQELRDHAAGEITLIQQKQLELARALASEPSLILLDEILAGLNPKEVQLATAMIQGIRKQFGVTILWIEHLMGAIMGNTDRIVVLCNGKKISDGKPNTVATDKTVIEAYLGDSTYA
ncbi:MAG: ABC transporter ATP-binding protein [Deltaproteobacteria bacterium]|nr:ABC transporter ATP-binding protein [Deltaproteobacteria bacterium]